MTIPELADRLGISQSKAYEMAQANELPFPVIRGIGGARVSVRAYESWLSRYDYQGDTDAETERQPVSASR